MHKITTQIPIARNTGDLARTSQLIGQRDIAVASRDVQHASSGCSRDSALHSVPRPGGDHTRLQPNELSESPAEADHETMTERRGAANKHNFLITLSLEDVVLHLFAAMSDTKGTGKPPARSYGAGYKDK